MSFSKERLRAVKETAISTQDMSLAHESVQIKKQKAAFFDFPSHSARVSKHKSTRPTYFLTFIPLSLHMYSVFPPACDLRGDVSSLAALPRRAVLLHSHDSSLPDIRLPVIAAVLVLVGDLREGATDRSHHAG